MAPTNKASNASVAVAADTTQKDNRTKPGPGGAGPTKNVQAPPGEAAAVPHGVQAPPGEGGAAEVISAAQAPPGGAAQGTDASAEAKALPNGTETIPHHAPDVHSKPGDGRKPTGVIDVEALSHLDDGT